MSPAPTIANIYVALHEKKHILRFLQTYLRFLKRFIDYVFGIWIHDPDPTVDTANWIEFKAAVNSGSLDWIFSPRSHTAIFMDMTLDKVARKITTSLYQKPNALHLYIPPAS